MVIDLDGKNLLTIEKVMSGSIFMFLTIVIGYFGLIGWMAKNALDKLHDNFEAFQNRCKWDFIKRKAVLQRNRPQIIEVDET